MINSKTSLNLCILLMLCWLPVSTASAQPLIYNFVSVEAMISEVQFVAIGNIADLKSETIERGEVTYTVKPHFKTVLKRVDAAGDNGEFETFTTWDPKAGKVEQLERWVREETAGLWLINKTLETEDGPRWRFLPFDENSSVDQFGYVYERSNRTLQPPMFRSDLSMLKTREAILERVIEYAAISQKQHYAWKQLGAEYPICSFTIPWGLVPDQFLGSGSDFLLSVPVASQLPMTARKLLDSPEDFLPADVTAESDPKYRDYLHTLSRSGVEILGVMKTQSSIELMKRCLDESAVPFANCSSPMLIRIQALQYLLNWEEEFAPPKFSDQVTRLYLQKDEFSDETLRFLTNFTNLNELRIRSSQVSSSGIDHLGQLENLEQIDLDDHLISDEVLQLMQTNNQLHLLTNATNTDYRSASSIEEVHRLQFWCAPFGDQGLKTLTQFRNLTHLDLGRMNITDAAIEDLSSLKNLKSLELRETNLSPEGIKELRKALPRCKVKN